MPLGHMELEYHPQWGGGGGGAGGRGSSTLEKINMNTGLTSLHVCTILNRADLCRVVNTWRMLYVCIQYNNTNHCMVISLFCFVFVGS